MIDYLGNVGTALERGEPAERQKLYEVVRLEMTLTAESKAIEPQYKLSRPLSSG